MSLAVIGVDGPTSSTDGHLAIFSGATGKLLKSAGYAPREVLSANRTYYVRSDGSDSNTGLSDTAGGAFLTLQKAWDTVAALDMSVYAATISVSNEVYTSGLSITTAPLGGSGVTIAGAGGTTAVETTGAHCLDISAAVKLTLINLKLKTTTAGHCIALDHASAKITFGSGVVFQAAAWAHMNILAGTISSNNNWSITGGAWNHVNAQGPAAYFTSGSATVTLTGTPAFSTAFAGASLGGIAQFFSNTYSGSATGVRYAAKQCGVVDANGGGATALPGNSAGTTASGGQYT